MRRAILVVVLLVSVPLVRGQSTWRRAYGALDNEAGHVVRAIHSDLFVIAGSTGSFGGGSSDIYLIAVDGTGEPLWSRTIGWLGVETATDMAVLPDGDIIIVGHTNSSGSGGYDGIVIRCDQTGAMEWWRAFGGSEWDFLYDVLIDDDKILATGETYSMCAVGGKAWLLALDMNGNEISSEAVATPLPSTGRALKLTTDGGFVMAGTMEDQGDVDALVVKFTSSGEIEWMESYGGDSLDMARDIVTTMDGGYSIVGATRGYSAYAEALHMKIDATGGAVWTNHWGQINDQEAYELVELSSGEFVSIGYTKTSGGGGSDMFLMKNSANGDFSFGRTFGGSEEEIGYSFVRLADGFICAGSTTTYGSGGMDVFVVRTDDNGSTAFETVEDAFDPLVLPERTGITHLPIHPNPSTGEVFFPASSSALRMEVVDAFGRSVSVQRLAPGTARAQLDLPTGLYTARLIHASGVIQQARLTIIRP